MFLKSKTMSDKRSKSIFLDYLKLYLKILSFLSRLISQYLK